jgi:hypothetical protein
MSLAFRLEAHTTGSSFAPAIAALAGDLLVASCDVEASSGTLTGVTISDDHGGTWTLIQQFTPSGIEIFSAWVRDTLVPSNATYTVTFTKAGTANPKYVCSVIALSGGSVAGASALVQSATNTGAATTTPAATFGASALAGNSTIGFVSGSTVTPPTSWTEQLDASGAPAGLEVATRDSGFTGTTITWGSTISVAWGSIIVELQASAAAALAVDMAAVATMTASLSTGIKLAASFAAQASMTAAATTQIKLAATFAAVATMTADMRVPINLQANAAAQATMTASLTTQIKLNATMNAVASMTASLTTHPYDTSRMLLMFG